MNDASVAAFESFLVKATLKGYKRILGVDVVRKLPVTVDMLYQIACISSDEHESGFMTVLLVGFFSFMRKSSLLPRKSIVYLILGNRYYMSRFHRLY